jgi:hypothetical protein
VTGPFCQSLEPTTGGLVLHAGVEGDLRLVHPRIAAPVAESLGVASRRRVLLAASADCLALGLAGAGGAVEAFGQSEALTTRLRHIIQVLPVLGRSPTSVLPLCASPACVDGLKAPQKNSCCGALACTCMSFS